MPSASREWWEDEKYWTELNQPSYPKVIAEASRLSREQCYQEMTDFITGYISEMGDTQHLEAALLARFDPKDV